MFEYDVKFFDGLVTVSVTVYVDDRNPIEALSMALSVVVEHSGVSFDVEDCRRVEVQYVGADGSLGGN